MCSRTAGVMTALMRNGRDRRSGKPVMGHAIVERVLLFGTRSADYIRASGHSGCIATEVILQATTGRIHDRTRTLRRKVRKLLPGRRPHVTHTVDLRRDFDAMQHARTQESFYSPQDWQVVVDNSDVTGSICYAARVKAKSMNEHLEINLTELLAHGTESAAQRFAGNRH